MQCSAASAMKFEKNTLNLLYDFHTLKHGKMWQLSIMVKPIRL